MGAIGEAQFREHVIAHMEENYPGAGEKLRAPTGRATLEKVIADARSYGLEAELDLVYYIIVAWTMGVDFHIKLPAFQEILTSKALTPSKKADAIQKLCRAILQTLEDSKQ